LSGAPVQAATPELLEIAEILGDIVANKNELERAIARAVRARGDEARILLALVFGRMAREPTWPTRFLKEEELLRALSGLPGIDRILQKAAKHPQPVVRVTAEALRKRRKAQRQR
jgi:hypothetical protein